MEINLPVRYFHHLKFTVLLLSLLTAISYTDKGGNEVTYSVGTDTVTYDDARRLCKQRGGDLTSINDNAEQEFIASNVIQETDSYWIGLDDVDTEEKFEWTDG